MINMVHLKDKDKQEAKTVVKLGVLSILIISYLGLSENVVYPIVPNGFADHYPY